MAQLFISYKRENLQKVQRMVEALRDAGVEVWWDQNIAPNAPWEATIERELNSAKVVIVAWSQIAVASESVKAEARRARNEGKLIQVFAERCDPPLFFGERQGVDLSDWNGPPTDHRFQTVLMAVRAILAGKRPPEGVGHAPRKRQPWATLAAAFAFLSAVLAFTANLGGAREAVCSVPALSSSCERVGLAATPADPDAERAALLRRVEGVWGNPAKDGAPGCAITFRYALSRRNREDYVTLIMPDGYQSTGRIVSAENGSIFTRTMSPALEAGAQWELRLEVDRLIQIDNEGTPTPLVRCGE